MIFFLYFCFTLFIFDDIFLLTAVVGAINKCRYAWIFKKKGNVDPSDFYLKVVSQALRKQQTYHGASGLLPLPPDQLQARLYPLQVMHWSAAAVWSPDIMREPRPILFAIWTFLFDKYHLLNLLNSPLVIFFIQQFLMTEQRSNKTKSNCFLFSLFHLENVLYSAKLDFTVAFIVFICLRSCGANYTQFHSSGPVCGAAGAHLQPAPPWPSQRQQIGRGWFARPSGSQ